MVDGVAHEVHERLAERIEDAFIEIGVLAGKFQGDVLAALFGDVAYNTRKTAEELLNGHHANLEDALVELIENARLESEGVRQLCADGIASVALVKFGQGAVEHGLADNQFADKIHDGVNASGIHTKRTFGNRGGSRSSGARFRAFRWVGILRGICDGLGGLSFEKITQKFVLRRGDGRGSFNASIGNDGRDAEAFANGLLRLDGGEGGFDYFDVGGREIILGAKGNQGSATVKDVTNELKSGGAHEAVGIDAQGDVVDSLPAMNGLGDHELFVFGPGETRRHTCGSFRTFSGASGFHEEAANQTMQGLQGGKLFPALVGGEHGFEGIGSGEDNFSEAGAMLLRHLGSQNVLKFVSQFAQLMKAASSGVAFEGMNGAANAANHLFVGGMSFQLEPRFIERLKQLVRAFEKDSAKLRVAIFGRLAQEDASTRW
jgi:hypothetical protein